MQAPIIINQERECVVVDGHSYCRDDDTSGRILGVALLITVLICVWAIGGIQLGERFEWSSKHFWFYYAGLPVAIALALLVGS